MSALIGLLLAMLGQLLVLPTAFQQQQQAAMTTTIITTAQQQQALYSAAQAYITQNLAAIQAAATASTPVVISVPTLAASNVGLPASFGSLNPFGQTWTVQVLQPTAGTLQALVMATDGTALTDLQAAAVAQNVGQPGGFIPQNDSGVYPLAATRVYGNQANYNIPTSGYAGATGGHPAALLVVANGTVQNNALYRVAVPGQPQLNQMQTALDLNSNNINNAATVNAQKLILPGGTNLQIGSSNLYGDTTNTALYQDGRLFIQHHDGSAADIAIVGNVTSYGTVTADSAVINGTATVNNGSVNVNNGQVVSSAPSWAVEGKSDNWAMIGSDGAGNLNAAKTSAAGSISVNDIQLRATGQWMSQMPQAPTSFVPIGWFSKGSTALGWYKWCGITAVNGPNNNSGLTATAADGQGSFYWQVTANSPDSSDIFVSCMN